MRTISEIIKDSGSARGISEASNGEITKDAVWKWPTIGVPDRHWPLLIQLSGATPDELYEANRLARGDTQPAPETQIPEAAE
jgi:hypothetical protein